MDKLDKTKIIKELINHYSNGNKADFARRLGISPQGLSTWMARNTFDIDLIYSKCEGVSAEWLLTGKGEMLKKEEEEPQNSQEALQLKIENNLLKELLKEKENQLFSVNQELGKLRERVSSFRDQYGESTGEVGLSGGGDRLPMPVDTPVIPSMPEVSAPATIPNEKLKPTTRTQKT